MTKSRGTSNKFINKDVNICIWIGIKKRVFTLKNSRGKTGLFFFTISNVQIAGLPKQVHKHFSLISFLQNRGKHFRKLFNKRSD